MLYFFHLNFHLSEPVRAYQSAFSHFLELFFLLKKKVLFNLFFLFYYRFYPCNFKPFSLFRQEKNHLRIVSFSDGFSGDPTGNRTRVTAVKGRCLDRLTIGPCIKRQLLSQLSFEQNRQRPTFPGSLPPSIISAGELNFCVRDGYRCVLPAIATGFLLPASSCFLPPQTLLSSLNVLLLCTFKTE